MSGPADGRRAWAPGRVNLIGDHTDYNDGLALPMAIGLGVEVEFRPGDTGTITLASDLGSGRVDIGADGSPRAGLPGWARLAAAVVAGVRPPRGGEVRVRSDLPAGVGLSSSAAFGVALSLALGADPVPIEIARLCQRAEEAIGVPVGLMDPLVAMGASAGHALLIDFSSLATTEIAVPEEAAFTIVDSGTARSLDASPYAARRAECEAAAALVGTALGRSTAPDVARLADPLLRRRARHVVTEVERVRAFAAALSSGDLPAAGELMKQSHRSLRDDFEVSTPSLDALVEGLCSEPGVLGARLTGAGFGGCVVVLSTPDAELSVANRRWPVRPGAAASVILL